MVFLTIVLFLAYTYGLGFSLASFVKESENFLERSLMRIGLGLSTMVTLGLFLNLIHIPLDWRIFLFLSLAIPAFFIVRNIKSIIKNPSPKFKITKYDLAILVMLIIFFATFYMYAKGAFSYPWLEDDDSWAHAIGAKYVAVEEKVFAKESLRYIDPYPPGYDMVIGILHQTNDSLYWTLKFFNALIVSLSIIFFFFMAKEILGKNKALFSAFALASVPGFLSHFIWAIALTVPLYFVSFYALERIKHDKKWAFVAAVVIAATLTISPSHSTYFGIFFVIYYLIKAITKKSFLVYDAAAGILGALISFFFWWMPSIISHGLKGTIKGLGTTLEAGILNVAGTGDRIYSLNDFFVAQKNSMINNPTGIGIILSLLIVACMASLILNYYKELKKNKTAVFAIFFALAVIALSFLSYTYVKTVQRGTLPREVGSVPFFEFLRDQIFFIASFLLMLFVFVSLLVINHKNPDFKEGHIIIILAWLIFSFYAVNAGPFHFKLSPFRAWSIFVIPVAILASEGMWLVFAAFKKHNLAMQAVFFIFSLFFIFSDYFEFSSFSGFFFPLAPVFLIKSVLFLFVISMIFLSYSKKSIHYTNVYVASIIILGILSTSAYQKYSINTAVWPPGAFWTSNEELQGYMWFKDKIPSGAKTFTFSNNAVIIGLDKFICHWCSDVKEYKISGFNESIEQNYYRLKKDGYKYVIIDGQAVRKFGINETNNKIQGFLNSNKFKPVFNNNGMLIFGVV